MADIDLAEAIKRATEAEQKLKELLEAADAALIALRTSQITDAAIQQEPGVLAALKRLDKVILDIYGT